jgi:hypothetical protein
VALPRGRQGDRLAAYETGPRRRPDVDLPLTSPVPLAPPSSDPLRPIFLHGLWRSGSTYVWSRFRAAEGSLCYYEPLSDGLRRLTHARILRDTPETMLSNNHPALAQPYFAEFAPLLAGRGVRGYQRRFAYTRFAPPAEREDRPLQSYVQQLIDHARGQQRAAVLGFNRTGLRVAWLKKRFDAYNIHIDRDPIDIFSSYLSQLQSGNYYYFIKWMQIIAGNTDYPLFSIAAPLFRKPTSVEDIYTNPRKFYRQVVDETSLETLYSITFLAWAVCAMHALEHCDLIIDTAMADRFDYGETLAGTVRQQCGLAVDFVDMHAPTPPSPLRLAHQRLIERAVLNWFASPAAEGLFDRTRIRSRLGELSPRRADLLAKAV